ARDSKKYNAVMQRYKELKEIQSFMAKRLGERVVLPK
ncbi:DNA primase, partial [termite gut metagenome]